MQSLKNIHYEPKDAAYPNNGCFFDSKKKKNDPRVTRPARVVSA